MEKFEVAERVYHRRKDDAVGYEGFGRILEIGPLKATLLWEDSEKEDVVDVRDLITEEQAGKEGRS
jgi:hypothetical protein